MNSITILETIANNPLIPFVPLKHGFLKSYFFLSTIIEWNSLDYYLRNAPFISAFKQNILKFICLGPK